MRVLSKDKTFKNKFLPLLLIPLLLVPAYAQESSEIPAWVKGVANFWVEGNINDDEFAESIAFLIEQGIIVIDSAPVSQQMEIMPDNEIIIDDVWQEEFYDLEKNYLTAEENVKSAKAEILTLEKILKDNCLMGRPNTECLAKQKPYVQNVEDLEQMIRSESDENRELRNTIEELKDTIEDLKDEIEIYELENN